MDGMDRDIVLQFMGQANYDEILPTISDDRHPGTINGGELGCVLSHLIAIRRAYLEGDEMAMIVEDDITPLLMQVHVGWRAYVSPIPRTYAHISYTFHLYHLQAILDRLTH